MTEKQAGIAWRACRSLGLNAVARALEKGPLQGEHVVEIEPRPALGHDELASLFSLAGARNLELSYGTSPRRVLVLS